MTWTLPRIAVGIIVLVALIPVVNGAFNRAVCSWYGHQTERDTRYAAFVGCMVKVDDHWVPRSELRTASE